jgi:PEGA domain
MTIQLSPRPPRILDDVWEPALPARRNRLPFVIAAAVLVIASATIVMVRAGVFEQDASPVQASRALWYPDPIDGVGWPSPRAPAPVASPARDPVRPAPPPTAPTAPAKPRPARPVVRAMPLPGVLAVNSTPWAELSVNGRVVGNTPQLGLRVAAGRHRLVLARDGFAAETTWVTVAPGATVKITGIALRRITP